MPSVLLEDAGARVTLTVTLTDRVRLGSLQVEGKDLVRAVTRLTHRPADCEDSDSVRHGSSSSSSSSSDSEACRPDVSCVLIKVGIKFARCSSFVAEPASD